ncbi:MAG: hypothetical protein K2Y21_02415 [Phycisphaerales bacterium]|nr:hypothetical protein [Phycisphaerales bacterium]
MEQRSDAWMTGLSVVAALLALAAGPIGVLVVRDFWLRRRIWGVLRTQGRCPTCGYSLLGLAATDGVALCPECGRSIELSKAMLALSGAAGAGRVALGMTVDLPEPLFSRSRCRRFARGAMWIGGSAALLAAASMAVNEMVIRRDAAAARRALLLSRGMPSGSPLGMADANVAFASHGATVQLALRNSTGKVLALLPGTSGSYLFSGMEAIVDPDRRIRRDVRLRLPDNPSLVGRHAWMDGMVTWKAVEECEARGLFRELAALDTTWRSDTRCSPGAGCFAKFPYFDWQGEDFNAVACVLNARLVLRADAGDWHEYASTLRTFGRVTRAAWSAATAADCNALTLIETRVMLDLCQRLSRADVDAAFIDAVEPVLDEMGPSIDIRGWVQTERAEILEMTAWLFSDPDRVRWGLLTPGDASVLRQRARDFNVGIWARLGTYRGNEAEIHRVFDWIQAGGSATPVTSEDVARQQGSVQIPASFTADSLWRVLAIQQVECFRRAARVQIALMRHRARTGHEAKSLDDLRGEVAVGWMVDPYSGKDFGFAVPPETEDERGVLYTVGPNRRDDFVQAHRWVRLAPAGPLMYTLSGQELDFRFDFPEP